MIKREADIKKGRVKTIDCFAWICLDLEKCIGRQLIQDLRDYLHPERSKREDHESGCGALNIVETQ